MDNILVSVICTAYNQEKFIRQCLDSFIMQETNFKFEVLINDDASTDGTADIIKEYEQKYPDIIKPIYQTDNQYSKGISNMITHLFPRVKGKYVAFCEGDDYWTDPLKLQKQFDFMEANPEYSACGHFTKMVHEPPIKPDEIIPQNAKEKDYTNITFQDILKDKSFHTSSYFFRWSALGNAPEPKIPSASDIFLLALFAKYGEVKFIPEVMSVYRRNPGGIYAGLVVYSDKKDFISKRSFISINVRKMIYDYIATDKEWYFKEVLYPFYTYILYGALKCKDWKSFFDLIYKNTDIYILMLKHWRVIPYLICKDIYRLLKKLYKDSKNKTN